MLEQIKRKINLLLIVCSFLEIVLFFNFITLWAIAILWLGWFLIKKHILTHYNMLHYPVSFFMLFGLALFHYVLPLPLTLIEFKPVTYNMLMPFETFLHHGLFVSVIVMTHFLYRQFVKRGNPLRKILQNSTFYKSPTNLQIWITSLLSLAFSFYFYAIYGAWENYGEKNIFIALGRAISIFLWMPLLIPFFKVRNIKSNLDQRTKISIIVYSALVVLISILSNWRTILYSGIIIFGLLYIIGVLYGYYDLKKMFNPKRLILLIVAVFVITGPIVDLGVAMVISRQNRYSSNSTEFFKNTVAVFNDKKALHKFETIMLKGDKISYSINRWNEEYLNNYVFNRYCNLKISDNCIYYANKLGFANDEMQDVLLNDIIGYVPGFVQRGLKITTNSNKDEIKASITDNLYSLAIDDTTVKGSAIIGSMPGVGLSIFGYWYLLIIIPIFVIMFTMFDSFAILLKNNTVHFSYFFFTLVVTVFNYFNDRHIYNFELRWIFRNYVESILIFLIVFKIVRTIEMLITKNTNKFNY
jgi:hypothetical protein